MWSVNSWRGPALGAGFGLGTKMILGVGMALGVGLVLGTGAAWAGAADVSPRCEPGATVRETTEEGLRTLVCETAAGLRAGEVVALRPDGSVEYRAHNREGRRHGNFHRTWPGGLLRAEGQYTGGLRTGPWTFGDPLGWQRKGRLNTDAPDGPWQVFAPGGGQPRAWGDYQNGLRHGPWQFHDGTKQTGTGTYDRGRFTGCTGLCPLLQPDVELAEAVDALGREAQACYQAQWKGAVAADQASVMGEVELAWQIGPDGAATGVRLVRETLPAGSARTCLTALVGQIRLPKPADGKPISTGRTFMFRPKSGFTDNLEVAGACKTADLRPVINVGRETLIRCVKGALAWPPPQPGQVQIRFAVTADGGLAGVGTEPHFDGGLTHCVGAEVARWRFTAGKPCPVRYTLRWE